MTRHERPRAQARQRGAGIIETMVGILIGLLVVVVVYNMLAVAEGYKRMTTGIADAQITGLIAHLVVGNDAGNAGSGMTSAFSDLVGCTKDETGANYTADNTLKPISLIITPGATANDSDSFVARQSSSPHVMWAVPLRPVGGAGGVATVAPAGDIQVQSPNGFMTPAKVSLPTGAKQFWAIAIANDGTGRCGLINIADATPSADGNMDTTGEVLLKQGTVTTTIDYKGVAQTDTGTGAMLLNLGRDTSSTRVRYEVNPPGKTATETNQLLMTDCSKPTGCAGVARNPIAQNVVWMKVQYGIDTSVNADDSLNGSVNCWTPADTTIASAGGTLCPVVNAGKGLNMPDWTSANVIKAGESLAIPASMLNRILAVRIGIVVRSDEADLRDPALYLPPAKTIDLQLGTRQNNTYLFNCAADTDAACPNRVLVPTGAAAPNVIIDGWRYRTYELVIPLRNNIFSATLPP